MATLHSDPGAPAQPRPPVTLLESFSPYGSRKVTVEYDGLVTAAYLYDDAGAISATWIAKHRPAAHLPARASHHQPCPTARGGGSPDAARRVQAPRGPPAAAGRGARGAVVRG